MTHRSLSTDRRVALNRSIDHALPSDSTACLVPADSQLDAFADRWYGRLVFASFDAGLADPTPSDDSIESAPTEAVTDAAAAIELLRGYCSLRYALFLREGDERPSEAETPQLLSADYLFAAAFERLGGCATATADEHTARFESCFETLTETAERSIGAMADHERQSRSPGAFTELIEGTAGALGWWAARTGAVLAGVPAAHRRTVASIGRAMSVHRQLRYVLDPPAVPGPVTPFPGVESVDLAPERDVLRRQAERRRDETTTAIESLPAAIDATPLRPLVRTNRSGVDGDP